MPDQETMIVIGIILFFLGVLLGMEFFASSDVNVGCVTDRVGDRIETGLVVGYVVHPLLSNSTTIQGAWNWYERYTFISRSLLEREIRLSLERCKE